MTLAGKDHHLVEVMSGKDCATSHELEEQFQKTAFALQNKGDSQEPALCYLGPGAQPQTGERTAFNPTKPILPPELSWVSGLGFLMLQGLIMVALVYTWVRAQLHDGNQF
jgi:hypothetical protein